MRQSLFTLSLAAFASIGLPVTLLSSFGGLMRALRHAPAERVGQAIDYGTAYGLIPGIALAAVVLANGLRP